MHIKLEASDLNKRILEICKTSRIIAVLTIEDENVAIPLAQAILAGGLPVLEITLRTPAALEAIRRMTSVKGAIIGAGTVLNSKDVEAAKLAGAKFAVSPGITDEIVDACENFSLPILGGVSSVSESMRMLNQGYNVLKFFPAEVSGGVKALQAINGPLPQVLFCPTGGINNKNALDYLTEPNVISVGGSWIATKELIKKKDWNKVFNLAKNACELIKK